MFGKCTLSFAGLIAKIWTESACLGLRVVPLDAVHCSVPKTSLRSVVRPLDAVF